MSAFPNSGPVRGVLCCLIGACLTIFFPWRLPASVQFSTQPDAIIAARRNDVLSRQSDRKRFDKPPSGASPQISTKNQIVIQVNQSVSSVTINSTLRRLGLRIIRQREGTILERVLLCEILDGTPVNEMVLKVKRTQIFGEATPNHKFELAQAITVQPEAERSQYVVQKLHLEEAHRLSTGQNVLIGVIDSLIDTNHPSLKGHVAGAFQIVDHLNRSISHGTNMAIAITSIAPGAKILAIDAFSPNSDDDEGTTMHILAALDWATAKGARIINMSFDGSYDPLISLALKKVKDKGLVMIASAGNLGPNYAPLYPAADENVIAVTASDDEDRVYANSARGPHIAIAAPGVNIVVPTADRKYESITGTSVAAAHVSGVVALLVAHDPAIDVAKLQEILYSTATNSGKGRDTQLGFGVVNADAALRALDQNK